MTFAIFPIVLLMSRLQIISKKIPFYCPVTLQREQVKENKSSLAMPSEQDIKKLEEYLLCLKSTEVNSIFIEQENIAIDLLLNQENIRHLQSFISVVWHQAYIVIRDYVIENGDKDDVGF